MTVECSRLEQPRQGRYDRQEYCSDTPTRTDGIRRSLVDHAVIWLYTYMLSIGINPSRGLESYAVCCEALRTHCLPRCCVTCHSRMFITINPQKLNGGINYPPGHYFCCHFVTARSLRERFRDFSYILDATESWNRNKSSPHWLAKMAAQNRK